MNLSRSRLRLLNGMSGPLGLWRYGASLILGQCRVRSYELIVIHSCVIMLGVLCITFSKTPFQLHGEKALKAQHPGIIPVQHRNVAALSLAFLKPTSAAHSRPNSASEFIAAKCLRWSAGISKKKKKWERRERSMDRSLPPIPKSSVGSRRSGGVTSAGTSR